MKPAFDSFSHSPSTRGWLNRWIQTAIRADKFTILKFAASPSSFIALLEAVCFFAEKYLTTSVGQWVTHDLRRLLNAHIQHLSLDSSTKECRKGRYYGENLPVAQDRFWLSY